jgi:hypothetical protein
MNEELLFVGYQALKALIISALIALPFVSAKYIYQSIFDNMPNLTSANLKFQRTTAIMMTIGTTVLAVFLIQSMPMILRLVEQFIGENSAGLNIEFTKTFFKFGHNPAQENFTSMLAQMINFLQKGAPMIAILIGGYQLLTNASRGMFAIKR